MLHRWVSREITVIYLKGFQRHRQKTMEVKENQAMKSTVSALKNRTNLNTFFTTVRFKYMKF